MFGFSLKEKSEIHFVILGEERARQQLQKCCDNYQADNILLLPLVPREKLPEMLSASDIGLVIQKKTVTAFNLPSKIPVILAVGGREAEGRTVSMRRLGSKESQILSLDEAVQMLAAEATPPDLRV